MSWKGWGGITGWGLAVIGLPLILFPDYASFPDDRAYICGRLAGLLGLAICLIQPVTMSATATKFLANKKIKFHQFSGITGGVLLLLHPIFFFLSGEEISDTAAVMAGKIALGVILAVSAAFLLVKWKKLKFPLFSKLHMLAFPAGLLGLGHAYFAGYTLRSSQGLLYYYLLIAACGLLTFLSSRIRKFRMAHNAKAPSSH